MVLEKNRGVKSCGFENDRVKDENCLEGNRGVYRGVEMACRNPRRYMGSCLAMLDKQGEFPAIHRNVCGQCRIICFYYHPRIHHCIR